MKRKVILFALIAGLVPLHGLCQDTLKDGLTIWTTSWDDGSGATGYDIMQWTYTAQDQTWSLVPQYLLPPEIAEEDYFGEIYDMGMDMIQLEGQSDPSLILTVSKGEKHFPSKGTEFQLRRLNADGEWELVQPPLFTTPADVSPLGVDLYYEGDTLHIAWTEDNDQAGPHSMFCDIFDQVYTVNADGTLTAQGEPVLAFSRRLNWGGKYPGQGGITGLTACDYDGDGDHDLIVGEMFYGDDPTATALHMIEKLSADDWADDLQELWVGWPDTGSEGVCHCDIDGDEQLDLINTSGGYGPWNTIYWFEKSGDELQEKGPILECNVVAQEYGLSVGHIFGLAGLEPEVTAIRGWELRD